MDPKTVQMVIQLLQFVTTTAPVAVEEVLKIRALLQQSPDVQANLKALSDDTITADQDMIDRVNKWLTDHGYSTV